MVEGSEDNSQPPPCTQCQCKISKSSPFESSHSSTPLSEIGASSRRGSLSTFPQKVSRIAMLGHRALRIHVTTVNAFPSTLTKNEIVWACLVDAVGDVEALKKHVEELKLDHDAKEQVITYVWGACAQLRGELVSKACHKTSSSYNIPGNMSPSVLLETIQWILKNDTFLYDKLNLENKTFDWKMPFCNQLFKNLFITQWFGARDEALRFPDKFRKVPDSILALIATVIECSLNTWLHSVHTQVKFTDTQFKSHYSHFMKKLDGLNKSCPTWLKQFKRDLYLKAW
ncbi:uncharacterized protein BJ212DRAFT_1268835 [Suillus subaureus]|uniref:DUF6532 domain-containing protein n=1 Tax=Suillus subaureus TaxID=48587 RepID=A0A9P7JEX2_9AGAM|nr:uncharacterized protein BJ212DRAFT_1268835 [Suillus subaureus]KAG1818568.1 hypothetical protein BJ212DRAFT_1268835 [Suillus subaureus]